MATASSGGLKKTLLMVGLVGVAANMVLPRADTVKTLLERDGHHDIEVERLGIFAFSFTSTKSGASCSGQYQVTPGSATHQLSCLSAAE